MKTISLFAVLAIALVPTPSLAQSTLEPCEVEFLGEYYRGVDKIIDDAVGGTPQLSLTILPSFSPESGVRVVGDSVYFVQFASSYWYGSTTIDSRGRGRDDFSSTQVKTSVHSATIGASIADRVQQTYAADIDSSRKSDRMGLDGVSYRFTKPGVGCGEAWSPDPGTTNARLVELSELLAKHAKLSKLRQLQRSEETIAELLSRMGR